MDALEEELLIGFIKLDLATKQRLMARTAFWNLRPSFYPFEHIANLPQHSYVLLHHWVLPSFDDSKSYIVYYKHQVHFMRRYTNEPDSVSHILPPFVKEITWDYERSGANVKDTFKYEREAALTQSRLDELLDEGKKIEMSFINTEIITMNDGIAFGIEIGSNGFKSFRLTWSSGRPKEWLPFIEWVDKLRQYLVTSLDNQRPL